MTLFRALSFAGYKKLVPPPLPYYVCVQVLLKTLDRVQKVFSLQRQKKTKISEMLSPQGMKNIEVSEKPQNPK